MPANQTLPMVGLRDLLNLHTKEVMLQMNCHAIGTVQAFNPATQHADVSINYSKTYLEAGSDGKYVERNQNYPLLADCPVICLAGGNASLTFPITAGDQCLVMFNDRDMDNWVKNRAFTGAPATSRLHSFVDGIALVGLNKISDYDGNKVVLRKDTTKVTLGDKINLENASGKLGQVISHICDAMSSIVSDAVATGGISPIQGPLLQAQITAVQNEGSDLLEG